MLVSYFSRVVLQVDHQMGDESSPECDRGETKGVLLSNAKLGEEGGDRGVWFGVQHAGDEPLGAAEGYGYAVVVDE